MFFRVIITFELGANLFENYLSLLNAKKIMFSLTLSNSNQLFDNLVNRIEKLLLFETDCIF